MPIFIRPNGANGLPPDTIGGQAPSGSRGDIVVNFLNRLWPDSLSLWDDENQKWLYIQTFSKGRVQAFAINDLDAAGQYVEGLDPNQHVYLGMGLRNANLGPSRAGGNDDIVAIPGLWHDIDIRGPNHTETALPATLEEALELCYEVPDLPPTLVIHSGGGIYPLWLFKEPWVFESAEDRQKAQALVKDWQKAINESARRRGWKLDSVGDLRRILRLPGSFNVKNANAPVLATILEEHSSDRRYLAEDFEPFLPVETGIAVMVPVALEPSAEGNGYPVATAEKVREQCGFIRHCIEDAAILPEQQWYAMITIVGRCQNGEQLVHEWSKPYPRYSKAETDKKLAHALQGPGPLTCEYIRQHLTADYCGQCPQKVKSPISLGWEPKASTGLALDEVYAARIEALNEQHAVIRVGGKCVVMNEVFDPVFKRPDLSFSSVSDFRNYYANERVVNTAKGPGQPKEVSLAKVWLESKKRRQYQGIVFSPGEDIPGYYNLYRGLDVEPRSGDWSLYKEHVRQIIAGGDEEVCNYILAWMAQLVQNPGGERPGTSIVLRGKQGTGKGCFVSQFGKLFGSHFLHITNGAQLTGRFNNHLKDALLVFCDEGTWGGDKTAEGVLKGMITEDQIMVEPKGKDAFGVKNHLRLIVASNNEWVIPAGLEERRFLVLDVSDARMQDRGYFQAIVEQMNNGGREAMLHDLLALDISDVNLRKVPRTNALVDQILRTMTPVQKFWFECLQEGTLRRGQTTWPPHVPTQELYKEFVEFCKDIGDRYTPAASIFRKQLAVICPGIQRKRLTTGDRPYALHFPSLLACRSDFERVIKRSIPWDEEDDGKSYAPF